MLLNPCLDLNLFDPMVIGKLRINLKEYLRNRKKEKNGL